MEKELTALQTDVLTIAKNMFAVGAEIKAGEVADIIGVTMPKVRGSLGGLYLRGLIVRGKNGFIVKTE